MTVYRFKIRFEEYDDVVREIDILSTQSFADFHYCILQSILFAADEGASFYMSNDRWVKGQEIALEPRPARKGETVLLMQDSILKDFINDPHQKIYYLFDYTAQWTFHVELFRILPSVDHGTKYPVCVKSIGDPPKQKAPVPLPKGVKEEEEEEVEADLGSDAKDEPEAEVAIFDESETTDLNLEQFGDEEEKEISPDEP